MNNYFFTSESVTEGHPDKIADLVSDNVANYLINQKEINRAAIETMVSSNMITVAGEAKSELINNFNEIESLVRETIREIGYEQQNFHWNTLKFKNLIHNQSVDIARGTDDFGAGDQGMMFGYACDENDSLMPSAIYYSHKITKALSIARHNGKNWIGPDGKAQVTIEYSNINDPLRISDVICSTQHSKDLKDNSMEVKKRVKKIIQPVLEDMDDVDTNFEINPTGNFVTGGPDGDVGVTGRKIIVDTYGGYAPHGGGAFSGKDCTKVDRSGAYMARYIAKNIVASGLASNATIQISYAIGIKEPVSIYIYCDGKVRNDISEWVTKNIDLTPLGIIRKFDLFKLNLSDTTNYGHFGKSNLPWEKIDLVKEFNI
jgi:S-adenosylmethionine synthetase|tara:strand:+ start:1406 stop:2524 length:1119 start_codon:yes stop_codon:yes gene_type:complete